MSQQQDGQSWGGGVPWAFTGFLTGAQEETTLDLAPRTHPEPYLLSFSFCEWAPSSADPTGSNMTFLPVAS